MYGTDTLNIKEETKLQPAVVDTSRTVNEITESLLNNYEVNEQKQILLEVKTNLTRHYEELRQNHLKGAEDYAKRIEVIQAQP
tara:strand:- start:150 stop:398 length:249 start_codon:yes stop_codon:yes gene_type:complete